jgi:hypothetical protein
MVGKDCCAAAKIAAYPEHCFVPQFVGRLHISTGCQKSVQWTTSNKYATIRILFLLQYKWNGYKARNTRFNLVELIGLDRDLRRPCSVAKTCAEMGMPLNPEC